VPFAETLLSLDYRTSFASLKIHANSSAKISKAEQARGTPNRKEVPIL
jgi:hypothetical protein